MRSGCRELGDDVSLTNFNKRLIYEHTDVLIALRQVCVEPSAIFECCASVVLLSFSCTCVVWTCLLVSLLFSSLLLPHPS